MASFEDRLLTALHEHTPVAPRRRVAPLLVAGVAAAAAVLGAVAVPALVGGTPAYAMTTNADGSITFTLRELRDLDSATAALVGAGVPAIVRPPTPGCTDTTGGERAPSNLVEWPVEGNTGSIRIHPSAMPAGHVLGLTALPGKNAPTVKVLLYDAPGPSCFPAKAS